MRGSQARRARGCARGPVLVLGDGSSRRRRPTEASSLNLSRARPRLIERAGTVPVLCLSDGCAFHRRQDRCGKNRKAREGAPAGNDSSSRRAPSFFFIMAGSVLGSRQPPRVTLARARLSTRRAPSFRVLFPRRRSPASSLPTTFSPASASPHQISPATMSSFASRALRFAIAALCVVALAGGAVAQEDEPAATMAHLVVHKVRVALEIRFARIARVTRVRSRRPRLVARRARKRARRLTNPVPTLASRSPSSRISSSSART